jgi:isopentenyl-diphosphate delta-isomerase
MHLPLTLPAPLTDRCDAPAEGLDPLPSPTSARIADPTPRAAQPDIARRKADHLDLCATDAVAFKRQSTLLEGVRLVHQSLPDLRLDDIDLSVTLLGKRLRAPIVIAAMTGGHERAAEVNRTLAAIAQDRGYGFGLGSQRAMQQRPDSAWTYQVREVAPDVLLLGNLGVVQARELDPAIIATMLREVGAHMNPAMELVQPGGDRDFRGGTETLARLVQALPVPVVGKETGNGISAQTAFKLAAAGVRTCDTSGAGGTSWVGVETLRAEGEQQRLGELLWDWGVPTAASVHHVVHAGMTAIATGGLRDGYDAARAIALGASAAGFARQVYMACTQGGRAGAEAFLTRVETQLRTLMLLVGAKDIRALQRAPRLITGELRDWMALPC